MVDEVTPSAGSDGEDRRWRIETTQRLIQLQNALRNDRVQFPESMAHVAREILAIPHQPGRLLDRSELSVEAIAFIRSAGSLMTMLAREQADDMDEAASLSLPAAQIKLFEHFSDLFIAIVGSPNHYFNTYEELAVVVRRRGESGSPDIARAYMREREALSAFYQTYARVMWRHAQELGGLKLVLGGQRRFGDSAFSAVKRMALYADTQLVPDPIFGLLEGDFGLNAEHNELIGQLFQILQLKPLIDARLPVPAVFVFPSFERVLENNDVHTQMGISELICRTLGATLNATFGGIEELTDFIRGRPAEFLQAVMRAQLFLPPGVLPGDIMDARVAADRYLLEISGYRRPDLVQEVAGLPLHGIAFNGIVERLAPQYHLLDNADELAAQPMLTQRGHWHLFAKASEASALKLQREEILTADGLKSLQALQDTRLAWLADIPMESVVELARNQEHLEFRSKLAAHTALLSEAGPADLDRVVREISHALRSMVQTHDKAISDIEAKYARKYSATWLTGGASVTLGVGAMFLPMLAAMGPVPRLVAATAAAGKFALDRFNKEGDLKQARSSLLGVLASGSPR